MFEVEGIGGEKYGVVVANVAFVQSIMHEGKMLAMIHFVGGSKIATTMKFEEAYAFVSSRTRK